MWVIKVEKRLNSNGHVLLIRIYVEIGYLEFQIGFEESR